MPEKVERLATAWVASRFTSHKQSADQNVNLNAS